MFLASAVMENALIVSDSIWPKLNGLMLRKDFKSEVLSISMIFETAASILESAFCKGAMSNVLP